MGFMSRIGTIGLLGLGLLLAGCSDRSQVEYRAQAGLLDLRNMDFRSGQMVDLNGEWDFVPSDLESPWDTLAQVPHQHREVPDLWKGTEAGGRDGHGVATYHLTVLLPLDRPDLAIRYISASTAFRLEAQGKTLVQVGKPSVRPEDSVAAYRPGAVRLGPVPDRLELTVRVSNYVYRVGGLWFPLDLGQVETAEKDVLVGFAVALGQAVALGAMACILMILFFFRPQERAFLFSGLLAADLAIRVLVTGDYILTALWPGFPFDPMIRIEYLTVFLSFPVATSLFLALIPGFLSRRWAIACTLASMVFVAFAVTLPLDLLTRTINGFYVVALLTVSLFLRSFWIHAVRERNRRAVLLFVGAFVLALAIINDVFYSSFLWKTGNSGTWGFLLFVVTLVWIDFQRLTSAFSEVELLVTQKDLLIMEIHHRVRNNLQMVSSLVSLQAKRTQGQEAKEALATLRSRIVSIALVHEKLYGRVTVENLDLGEYLQDLVRLLVPKEALDQGTLELSLTVVPLERPVKLCLDVGLIVTELINNAMKHSLVPRGGGKLRVSLAADGPTVVLEVEDDGPGFKATPTPDQSRSLGYKLIASLLQQNHGSWTILPGPGGRVSVRLG